MFMTVNCSQNNLLPLNILFASSLYEYEWFSDHVLKYKYIDETNTKASYLSLPRVHLVVSR